MNLLSKSRRRWFVEAAGKVWGPYADSRLVAFADEGRIGAQTLVAPSAQGPFLPVRQHPELADLFTETPPGAPAPAPAPQPAPRPVIQPIPLKSAGPRPAAVEPLRAPEPRYQLAPQPIPQPAPAPVEAARPAEPMPANGRALLVWASIGPSGMEPFEQLLAMHGPQVRLGPGLWLVRARITAPGLRNALTRRLRGAEALVVAEASLAETAWFNLDGDVDRAARGLWAGQ